MIEENLWSSIWIKVTEFDRNGRFRKLHHMRGAYDGSVADAAQTANKFLSELHCKSAMKGRFALQEVLVWNKEVCAWADKTLDVIDAMLPEGLV